MSASLFRPAHTLPEHPTVILYGAGNVGRDVHALVTRRGGSVKCFLDRRARPGALWKEVPIFPPDGNPLTPDERACLPVIITIFNRDADIPQIAQKLVGLGYGPCISFVDFHDRFAAELGDRFWLTRRGYYEEQARPIAEASALWADEASRDHYATLIEFRRTGEYTHLPPPQLDQPQYFPRDVPDWLPTALVRFVDCGAYDGDTLAVLADMDLSLDAVVAFEPALANFRRLAERARTFCPMPRGGIALWPCAVGRRTELLAFSSGQGEGSHLKPGGETVAQCVALDDALPGFWPNFIKMDIEGAESDALQGSQQLIRQHRPRLAICVYHRPGHLWEIPLLLHSWHLGYRFHLRTYGYNHFEVCLYAVPA